MKKVLLWCLGILLVCSGVAMARTFVERQFGLFSVVLRIDSVDGFLRIDVNAQTQDNLGTIVRRNEVSRIPLPDLAPAERNACRACYNAVFDIYSTNESIPTPTPTVTP